MELVRIVERLHQRNVEFVLVVGLAAYLYGNPIPTEDVDVCLHFTKENLEKLAAAVSDLHPRHRLTANRMPFEITDQNWSIFKNIYLPLDWGVLDCLGEVAGIGKYADLVENSQPVKFAFGECRSLTIEALIRAKQAVGRPHDMKTVGYLKAIEGKKRHSS